MKKSLIAFFICFIVFNSLQAQTSSSVYKERINTISDNINQYFYDASTGLFYEHDHIQPNEKKHSYLWPLCALIQAANEAEAAEPSKAYLSSVLKAIGQYYSDISPAPAYQAYVTKEEKDDRFYDDNQWIAIACIDAYNRTKQQHYLDMAEMIYRFMMTGYDTISGGGLYWKEGDKTTKNTCSNGPGILIALQLYKITNNKNYLDTALVLYNWVNAHLRSPEGVYYDNVKLPSLKIDSAVYTYNTGTMLQSNVLLYEITQDKKYLTEAQQMAKAAEKFFYKNGKLPGNYWFNVVLLRGYMELYAIDHNRQQIQFFIDDANRTWQEEKDQNNLLGRNNKRKSLIDQAAMMEIYARLSVLN
jgi:uncharacterized protein YyaL (SSP411 family)